MNRGSHRRHRQLGGQVSLDHDGVHEWRGSARHPDRQASATGSGEPERSVLLDWHQDDDHPDLGPVHLQVNEGDKSIGHKKVQFIDKHPMAGIEARLNYLADAIEAIEWKAGNVIGLEW